MLGMDVQASESELHQPDADDFEHEIDDEEYYKANYMQYDDEDDEIQHLSQI